MNRLFKTIIVLGTAISVSLPTSGQNADISKHSIDLSGGFSSGAYSLKGDVRSALGSADGGFSSLRYTYYLNDNLGLSVQYSSNAVTSDDVHYFGALNKADGKNYRYRFQYYDDYSYYNDFFEIGAAWRVVSGKIFYIPRVAVGFGEMEIPSYSYERRIVDGSKGPEYTNVSCTKSRKDAEYLINSTSWETYVPATFQMSASMQLGFKPIKHIILFVEPGFDFAFGRFNMEYETYGSKKAYEPSNYVEAVAYAGVSDKWVVDRSSESVKHRTEHLKSFFHLSFGVGFEFNNKRK